MYENPLSIIYEEIQTKIIEHEENKIVQAVQNCGISVNKEELIKALMYDRQQYKKGYADAKAEQGWILCSERLPEFFEPVITWDGHCYSIEKRIPYIRDEDGDSIKAEWWVSDDYDEEETDHYPNLRDGAAIAWMPLPKPYKGE